MIFVEYNVIAVRVCMGVKAGCGSGCLGAGVDFYIAEIMAHAAAEEAALTRRKAGAAAIEECRFPACIFLKNTGSEGVLFLRRILTARHFIV